MWFLLVSLTREWRTCTSLLQKSTVTNCYIKLPKKVKKVKAVYSASWETHLRATGRHLPLWDHTVLPATRHKWTRPAITPGNQAAEAGTRFTYPGGMEGWVDLDSLIAARPGIETTTAWSQVRRPNRYATKPPLATDIKSFQMKTENVGYKCFHWMLNVVYREAVQA